MKPSGHRIFHGWWQRWLPIIALSLGLAGCTPFLKFKEDPPGPGVPRISRLELSPNRIILGCPVTIRFLFEDPDADLLRFVAHWQLYRSKSFDIDRRYITLPVAPEVFTGRTRGEVNAQLMPERYGRYRYHVQAEDVGGRKSNILQASIIVEMPPPWATTPPICESWPAPPTERPETP